MDLTNQYFNTDQYLELQARRQFGKAAPGETLILVPKHVALKHTVDLPDASPAKHASTVVNKPLYQRNFEAWMSFLFHRQTTEQQLKQYNASILRDNRFCIMISVLKMA